MQSQHDPRQQDSVLTHGQGTGSPRPWKPIAKSRLIGMTLMLRRTEGRRRRGHHQKMRWHHRLNGREFEQTPGGSGGQRIRAHCRPQGRRVGHDLVTEQQQ